MRDFTKKEKELIANTPITLDCFDMQGFDEKMFARNKESGLEMTLLFYNLGKKNGARKMRPFRVVL